MDKNKFLDVIHEYHGKSHQHGVFDCNLMVLEATGYNINSIPPYSTAMEGLRSLRSTGYRRMGEYLSDIGYKKVNPVFIADFDIVVQGINNGIYLDGKVFSFNKTTNQFDFNIFDRTKINNKTEVYQWHH